MAITACSENFNFTPFRPRESPQHYIKKLFGKPISHTLHNDATPMATKVKHFMFKKAERQPSTPTEPLHTCMSKRRAGETEKQECWEREDVGNWWAVARACTNRAERMGAARATSSADSSHGCGSYAVIAVQELDTPSFRHPCNFFICKLFCKPQTAHLGHSNST